MAEDTRTIATPRTIVVVATLSLLLTFPAARSLADQGDCSQPVSTGASATATDCLYILQAAVGAQTCTPECICAPTGNLPISATNALFCLNAVVSPGTPLNCPCLTTTSSSSTTVTTTTTNSTTTLGATTTTSLEQCPAQTSAGSGQEETADDTANLDGPPPCHCVSGDGPTCNGACPSDAACLPNFEFEICFCQPFGCGGYEGTPTCYGLCDPGESCVDLGIGCDCVPNEGVPCTNVDAPQCDGDCPNGQFCHQQGDNCACVDVTCGAFAGAPACLGVCPPGETCFNGEFGCECAPE